MESRPLGRPPLPVPVGSRRKIVRSASLAQPPPPQPQRTPPPAPPTPVAAAAQPSPNQMRGPRTPQLNRSMSLDVIDIDTSHIDGLDELRRQLSGGAEKNEDEGEEEEAEVMAVFAKTAPAIVAPDLPEKPVQVHGYTAEEIALRRFMTTVAWGTGMHVLKHNRGKGRVRRVLRFNDDEGYLSWCGVLPHSHATRVPAELLRKATRTGHLVTLKIRNQGDVGFQCSRLTDAIVIEAGLNGVIRACKLE